MNLPHPYPEGLAFPVSTIKSAAGVTARAGLLMVCASDFLQE